MQICQDYLMAHCLHIGFINMEDIVINDNFINRVFTGRLLDKTTPHFCITYKGRIVVNNGRMLYDSRKQAVAAFYNCFHWHIGYTYRMVNNLSWDQFGRLRGREKLWKYFKDAIKNDLKIIQV